MAKILIIEDDLDLAQLIAQALRVDHHQVETVLDGRQGWERLNTYGYDLLVLDWNLPEMSGLDLCRRFRAAGGDLSILFLTGRHKLEEKETGLDAGADDYLTKPFSVRELTARVRALLRRSAGAQSRQELKFRDISLNREHFRVTMDGNEIHLNRKEFALLELFMGRPDSIFDVQTLLSLIWPEQEDATGETVRTHIKNLRKKMKGKKEAPIIDTIYGAGYKLGS